ncbi:junctional protein associated with coronary artery disease [Nematolebias whitei]|uniref:junctional protein associated with coronary artery disease n=1 Tax=Nematolebias whitei TaxID=451745 RepID=UPI0018984BA4|nr:junctional protein associated with coronary artery disease [Nematolebias whitei]
MYSVEDLLISHGYKLPKHPTSSTPTAFPTSSSCQPSSSSPPSYSKCHKILENRPDSKTVNGYEMGPIMALGNSGGMRQVQAVGGGCPNNNNEPRDGSQQKQDAENRGQTDTHSLGESLTSDSGFCDASRGPQLQSKDVSFWRRRGQDFTVLPDYTNYREPHGSEQEEYIGPEGLQQATGQELSVEDHKRAAQERQHWVAQVQVQTQSQAQVLAHNDSKEREAALHQWRMAAERKCQSLGTEEWHPTVTSGPQLSQSEDERWAQEQQQFNARTPEEMVVHPRTKAKSQSRPRMLQSESLRYMDVALSGRELYRRVNGHPPSSFQNLYRAPHWPENGRPASANQLPMTPKLHFTRPPRPPSYEMHQQIRGSCEVLSSRESLPSHARDRTPIPISRTTDHNLDYFAQDSGPPVYIPPPSYKRIPIIGGGRQGYGDVPVDHRYRRSVYQQVQMAPDGSHWFFRHPASSWPGPHRERSMSNQKKLYSVYSTQKRPRGGVQYISFDDPHIRHISSAPGGNSLTDADKIRHIFNELPRVTVSEPAHDDCALLPPPLGPFISAKMKEKDKQMSSSNFHVNERWQNDLHKKTIDNFPASDQNCNNSYNSKSQLFSSSPSSAFQALFSRTSSHQESNSEHVFAKTITQVKTIVPDSGAENNRNTKRRVSETIFCLVSVPIHTPTNIHTDLTADQNNNEAKPNLTITNTKTFAVGLKESPNIRSKSVNEMPLKSQYSHFHSSRTSSMRNYKRAPLRKEVIDAWVLQANKEKNSCYAGSWPGNQYRNQETQTVSPIKDGKSPEPQSLTVGQEPIQSASNMDNNFGTDSPSSYGYPMAGQKNLHPSRNSAFSCLSISPIQTSSFQPSQQDPSSPSKAQNQTEHLSFSSSKMNIPPESAETVIFGQFLLKPVNQWPCDVIGELETINKEMEDTISKRPNVGQILNEADNVDKRRAWVDGPCYTAGPEAGQDTINLPPIHIEQPNHIIKRSKSFDSSPDLESIERNNSFLRPQANKNTLLLSSNPRDNFLLSSLPPHDESNQLYKQDIPVPQESLLRDVGLTVYTETPGGPGKPMQRSLSVPSSLSQNYLSQSKSSGSFEQDSDEKLYSRVNIEQNAESEMISQCRDETNAFRKSYESCIAPQKESSSCSTKQAFSVSFVFEDDDSSEIYALSESLTYKNDSTMADRHLESLLNQEKANSLPAEDLSNLYEVQCAEGIPENESRAERAAQILGIAFPVETLCVADKQADDSQPNAGPTLAEKHHSSKQDIQYVVEKCVQVSKKFLTVQGANTEETRSKVEVKPIYDHTDGQDNQDTNSQPGLDLPEFPPSKLLLSLPVAPDKKLALSMYSAEKKGRDGACKQIDSVLDKMNCSAVLSAEPLTSLTTERMSRFKKLDSVSQIRSLSLKSPVSEEKTETKERVSEAKGYDFHQEDKEWNENRSTKDHNQVEHVNENLKLEIVEELKDDIDRGSKKERKQEEVEENAIEVVLTVDNKQGKEVFEEKIKLNILEEGSENTLMNVREEHTAVAVERAELTQQSKREKFPIPKQRTRFQKPPLLPKPCSVPKREVTLPPSSSTRTCGPTYLDDKEMLCVPGGWV